MGDAMRFENKNVVITGGPGNIGLPTAKAFLQEGANVVLVDNSGDRLRAAATELASDRVVTSLADVRKSEDVVRYAEEAVKAFGKIDIFFNNAGIEGPVKPLTEFPDDEFDRVMDINVRGVYLGCKYVAPHMRDNGSIIITSSVAGMRGSPNLVAYTTSKWAVVGIMKSAAIDLAERGIRCNTIHPGMVESDMLRRIEVAADGAATGATREALIARTPLKRYVAPSEISDMVLFLASDAAKAVTGSQFVVDAGFMA